MTTTRLDRRAFLARSTVLGCCAAASPLLTPVSFAAPPWDNRLVVIVLRGAMDGLDVLRPWGDRDFAALRGRGTGPAPGEEGGAHDLDGFFALHPTMGALMPLWQRGELGFAHAVSTPYRDKRSHFDGQDMLEAGIASADGQRREGWLNRLLQGLDGVEADTAYSVGRSDMLLTRGAAPVANWSPDARLTLSAQALKLAEMVMHDDPLFRDAMVEAFALAQPEPETLDDMDDAMTGAMTGAMMDGMEGGMDGGNATSGAAAAKARRAAYRGHQKLAEFTARRLRGASRIAAFSLTGWDTHAAQDRAIERPLIQLSEVIETLRDELGPVWNKTAVVALTEFGRTARMNGTGGSDHGTASAMITAGGALRGGRVRADWPGLAERDLYQGRDLMPTRDVRAHLAWIMRGLFGVSAARLESEVFPGLDMGADPRWLA